MTNKFPRKYTQYSNLVGRIMLGSLFVFSGLNKVKGIESTQTYMLENGVPLLLLPLVVALEIGGGVAVIVGWQTRLFALAFAGFLILTAFIFHFRIVEPFEMVNFMKDIALSGAFLIFFAHGPGKLSLDQRRPIEG